jgi:hypothetical protein
MVSPRNIQKANNLPKSQRGNKSEELWIGSGKKKDPPKDLQIVECSEPYC